MAAERVGLVAVFDLRQFNKSYNSYINSLNSLNTNTDRTAKGLTGSFIGLGNSLLKVAAILSGAVVAGATVAGAALAKLTVSSIKDAANLEQGVANIASVLNMTKDEAGFLKDVIVDLGLDPTLKVTTFEAADALELLAKNGIFAGMTMEEMDITARNAGKAVVLLANATGANFGQAANIASTAMTLFNLEAEDMVGIVSGITSVTTNSKFTIDDYELALRNGGAAVAQFGVELEDFNTLVALSAEELGTGMKAGTGLLNFMNRLTPNTKKATEAMQDLGLITADGRNIMFDTNGELKDMAEISEILNKALYGTEKVIKEVGGRTAEQNQLLSELNAEYKAAEETVADYTTGVKSILASEDEKNKALDEAYAIMEKLSPEITRLSGITGDYTTELQTLTMEQRSAALETIFGNDAMKTALAVANEGKTTYTDVAAVVEAFGVSHQQAAKMVAEGLTQYELLQQQMSKTDAEQNAATRMDTLKGRLEILDGVIEAIRINIGDKFIPVLTDIANYVLDWFENNKQLIPTLENIADAVATLVDNLFNGEDVIGSFSQFLSDVGGENLAQKFMDITQAIEDFITPIREFVTEHAEEFEGALKGIGIVFAGAMSAAVIAGIAGALWSLVNPVTALIVVAGLLGAAWETNFGNIQGIVGGIVTEMQPLVDIMTNLFEATKQGGLKGFTDSLASIKIPNLGRNQFGSIDTLGELFINLQEKAQPIVAFFTALRNTVLPSIQSIIQTFQEFQFIGLDMSSETGQSVVNIGEQLKATWSALQPIFAGVASVLTVAYGAIISFSTGALAGGIEPFLRGLGTLFTGLLMTIEGIATVITSVFEILVGIFTGNFEKIRAGWEHLGSGVVTLLEGLANMIVGIIGGLLETIVGYVGGGVQTMIDFFTNLYMELVGASIIPDMVTGILMWFTTLYEDGLAIIMGFVADTIQWFVDMATSIVTTIALFILQMMAKFRELFRRIKEVVKEKIEEIKAKFQELVDNIKQIFDDFDWKAVGQSIMNGIIDGIANKLESAKATILGVAEGVKEAWDSFWNSHSPSRLMIESSQDIMEGAIIGIKSKVGELTSSFATAGFDGANAFSSNVSNIIPNNVGGGGVTNNNSNTVQNFNVNNSFAGNPQVTDADQLRLALAGFT